VSEDASSVQRRPDVAWDAVTTAAFPDRRVGHLHLLRHGAVDTGGARLAYGHSDLPLTAAGEAAGDALRRFVVDQLPPVDGVLSSDLSRCRHLADAVAAELGVPLLLDPALREQHMGEWEGRAWSELTAAHEQQVRDYWEDYVGARPPGGESLAELAARVGAWWVRHEERLLGGRWVVVTHVGVLRVLLCRALGVPLDQALRFAPGRGTHSHLLFADTGWVVQALGEQPPQAAGLAPQDPTRRVQRIALSGSAGTGKSTLARALAARLELPYIAEGMRTRIEGGLDLHRLDHDGLRALLLELWEEQQALEDAAVAQAGGFVADRSPWDFAAFWLHYHFSMDPQQTTAFFGAVRRRAAAMDRILLLPWGVLPLQADGVRSTNAWMQRHYQATLEGLLQREAAPGLVAALPGLDGVDRRLQWVLDRL